MSALLGMQRCRGQAWVMDPHCGSSRRFLEDESMYRVTVAGRIFEGNDYRRLIREAVRAWRAARALAS